MQRHLPRVNHDNLHPELWVRKRSNRQLEALCAEPVTKLYGTAHDAWKSGEYRPDDVWTAAVEEFDRRWDRYQRLLPVT